MHCEHIVVGGPQIKPIFTKCCGGLFLKFVLLLRAAAVEELASLMDLGFTEKNTCI